MNYNVMPPSFDDLPAATEGGNTCAGRVVSTAGAQVIILLESGSADAVQMGLLVTMRTPHATVYGLIEALSKPMPINSRVAEELMLAEIGLLGEVPHNPGPRTARFLRGVSNLPSLDTPVYLADHAATELVYAFPGRPTVTVGAVAM